MKNMIKVATRAQIVSAEKKATQDGTGESELIERAALQLFSHFEKISEPNQNSAIFVGGGNNGADGLSLALLLQKSGYPFKVFIAADKMNDECCLYLDKIDKKNIEKANPQTIDLSSFDFIFDGILGTGCTRPIEGKIQKLINIINDSCAYKISIDIPSGLNADTGKAEGGAVISDETLTFCANKLGQLICDGRNFCGKITICDIGVYLSESTAEVIDEEIVKLPLRKTVSHKGNYGSVAIIAGSPTMVGGALLAHESAAVALKSGCGYSYLCVPRSLASAYQSRVREEMLYLLPDIGGKLIFEKEAFLEILQKTKTVVIGMGLGQNENVIEILKYLSMQDITLVIDADGLNALARDINALNGHKCKLILTPHVGEFRRLSGCRTFKNDAEAVKALAKELNCVIAMKSATTIISDGDKVFLNITGTPAMAKAGSGDVLAGMVGAFASMSNPLIAAIRACYYFGKAGERAATDLSEHSVLASDIIIRL